ncbi:MAG: methionyl-tRNA formyltransferase [Actinomycetota bacterium]|nr:MAG: methionyl-tRNA formyltransferase [Actinomycetota bacterium]
MGVRVAFMGNDPWSVPALRALVGEPEIDVALVLTRPPRPGARTDEPAPTPVAAEAAALGLPAAELERVGSAAGLAALRAAAPEAIVVVAFGELLGPEVLELPPLGAVNLHFSLLPRWRGAAPVQHAILAGDATTGVTVIRINAGLDTGPILASFEEPIRPDDDAGTLGGRLAELGARLLVGVVRRLPSGDLPERPQDPARATLAPRLTAADRVLRWDESAERLVRRVRALAPEPGATTVFRGAPLKVLAAATSAEAASDAAAGRIVAADDRGVAVAAGEGVVRLLEVAPAGRRRMSAAAWARGARFAPDERLG